MTTRLGPDTLILITPARTSPLGDPVPGSRVEREVKWCAVYPRTSTEADGRAGTTIVGLTAQMPIPMEDVTSTMLVSYRGREYKVDGEAVQWTYLDGVDASCQVNLKLGKG